jgi:RHS repeat-associated protein
MTTEGGSGTYTYTYDAENRLTSAIGPLTGGFTYCYVYDGNGLRVEKFHISSGTCSSPANPTVDALYWRMLSGETITETDGSGNITSAYVFFNGQRIARQDSSGNVYYYYFDQIGSATVITNGTGTACYQATFTPYGEEHATQNNCPQNYKFAGYERDAETGLDYAFARSYDQRLGRFMSTDPLGGGIGDPQSHNRYAYVTNTPTSFVDPIGMNKCAPPMNQSLPTICEGGGYVNQGFEDFFSGELSVEGFTSWDWVANYGIGGFGGVSRIPDIINLALHQRKLSKCLHAFFGPGNVLTNQNLPRVDTTLSEAQLSAQTGNSAGDTIGATQQPVPASGPGTVEIASEYFYGAGTTDIELAGTYLHETANILAYQTFTSTRYVQRPYQGPLGANPTPEQYLSSDPDIGNQFEKCVFGTERPK